MGSPKFRFELRSVVDRHGRMRAMPGVVVFSATIHTAGLHPRYPQGIAFARGQWLARMELQIRLAHLQADGSVRTRPPPRRPESGPAGTGQVHD
jgi:hypothetical protein